jgi:Viral BACON domain
VQLHFFRAVRLTIPAVIMAAVIGYAQGPACTFAVSPQQLGFDASGGSAEIKVTASAPDCSFTVKNGYRWIAVSPTQGKGSDTLSISVAPNASRLPHMGSVSGDGTEVLITIYAPKITGGP